MENKMNRTTKIIWEKNIDDLEGKCKAYVERYPYLKEEKYSDKRSVVFHSHEEIDKYLSDFDE